MRASRVVQLCLRQEDPGLRTRCCLSAQLRVLLLSAVCRSAACTQKKPPLLRELAQNAAILVAMILADYVLRAFVGESRTVRFQEHGIGIIKRIFAAPVMGPIASLLLYIYQPLSALFHWTTEMTAVFLSALVALLWVLLRWLGVPPPAAKDCAAGNNAAVPSTAFWQSRNRVFVAGIVLLVLSYVTSFTSLAATGHPRAGHVRPRCRRCRRFDRVRLRLLRDH